MKKLVAFGLCVASFALCAAECHWIGSDGVWSAEGNWKDGVLPAAGDTVVFDNTSPAVVSLDQSETVVLGGFSAGADVTIVNASGYTKGLALKDGATISVGAGATVSLEIYLDRGDAYAKIAKTGSGTFRFAKTMEGYAVGDLDVQAGVVELATTGGDSFCAQTVHVCKDAEVRSLTVNGVANNVAFDLDEGGRFKVIDDTFGPVTGKGLCYSSSSSYLTIYMVLPERTVDTGVVFSNVSLRVVAKKETSKIRFAEPKCLRDAILTVDGTCVGTPVVFDRRFRSWQMAGLNQASDNAELHLENEAGEPIVVRTLLDAGAGPIMGPGEIIHDSNCRKVSSTTWFTTDSLRGPGRLTLEKGSIYFGNLSGGSETVTPNALSEIVVNNQHNAILYSVGSYPAIWTVPISGTGRVQSGNTAGTTFTAFNLNAGSILWATQPCEITGGKAYVNACFADGATVRLSGTAEFTVDNLCLQQDNKKAGMMSRVEIGRGATLCLKAAWSALGGSSAAHLTSTYVAFDGGRLSIGSSSSYAIIPFAGASDHHFTVGTLPALIRADGREEGRGATFAAALTAVVASGVDGGLVKDGVGRIDFSVPLEIGGPVRVIGGRLSSSATDATKPPFGTGAITVENAVLALSGANAPKTLPSLSYGGGAQLYFTDTASKAGTGATIGALTAADDASVLFLRAEANGKRPGAGYAVTATSRSGGTLVATDDSSKTLSLVTRDGTSGALGVVACEADYATATALADNVTVANVHVGAAVTLADGVTLTVGDGSAPAPILFDGTATLSGGTVSFGGSRGVLVAAPGCTATVASRLEGTGGLAVAGLYDQVATVALGGDNAYSGGTVIAGARVIPTTALGAGTVTVRGGLGSGGTLDLSSASPDTVANDLVLSGDGVWKDNVSWGALRLGRTVTFTGTVTLANDTRIRLYDGAAAALSGTLAGGAYDLNLVGKGTLTLSGANDVRTGRLMIADEARLSVASAAALGAGPVSIDSFATLEFTNAGDITVTNVLTGAGTIALNGTGKVTFTQAAGFTGKYVGTGAQERGGDYVFNAGSGVYDYYRGELSGTGGLVKDGASTVRLGAANTYAGATHVKAGLLSLGSAGYAAEYIANGSVLHLDASKVSSITFGDDAHTNIYAWADADGRDLSAVVPAADTKRAFDYHADSVTNQAGEVLSTAFNPAVNQNYLSFSGTDASSYLQTFIAVLRPPSGPHPLGTWNFGGVYGSTSGDNGIRIGVGVDGKSYVAWEAGSMDKDGTHYVNGVLGKQFDKDVVSVSTIELASGSRSVISSKSIGDYWHHPSLLRCYWGDMCEIVGFDGTLAASDRQVVENYLMGKWGVTAPSSEEVKMTDVLPATTVLTVDEGAIVELNGGDQTLAGLVGHGTIRNSSKTPSVITLTGDSRFDGVFEGNITVILAEGVTLDLNDGAVTVVSVGGCGSVGYGTLTVTDRVLPGGTNAIGTLTFATAPVLTDATVEIDLAGNAADAVVVAAGDADVTAANLVVLEREPYTGRKTAVFTCADGLLTGPFAEAALPGDTYSVRYTENAAVLRPERGMLLILR